MARCLRFVFSALIFILDVGFIFGRPQYYKADPICGYQSCPKINSSSINIHLIAHSHDDVGWLKTVDQYFYGSRNNIQRAGVQYIIDSVVQSLLENPDRRFIQVETAFLWKWWEKQNSFKREQIRNLVNNGQLEIIGGAWSMNDEAAVHYQSVIDQFTWGFHKLDKMFGKCGQPRIGWQIDPFGHSREMASIFAQLGFDGLFFSRLDWRDKNQRLNTKTAEMLWNASANLGVESQLFTSILRNHYSAPSGFCFDINCNDLPIIDDEESPDYNVESRVKEFVSYLRSIADNYVTNNIAITMGDDFTYQSADTWFTNMDKLIFYTNKLYGDEFNVLYSTPSCYVKAVNSANREWPVKTDDFFPYASDPHAYWTGYYTSRPTSKHFERNSNNLLQICKQLSAVTMSYNNEINELREAMGVMQHHDAITGTEKQHVADDYARLLNKAAIQCSDTAISSLQKIMETKSQNEIYQDFDLSFEACQLLNISECSVTENYKSFVVLAYNPYTHPQSQYIRLPVADGDYSVKNDKGETLVTQIVPIPNGVLRIPGRFSQAEKELVFLAEDLPPLGYKVYYVVQETDASYYTQSLAFSLNETNVLEGDNIKVLLNNNDGTIQSINYNGKELNISQDFLYYKGHSGNNSEFEFRASGAYIFRPDGSAIGLGNQKPVTRMIYKGPLVEEAHQQFNDWITQVVRVYKNSNSTELDWVIGPIPIDDAIGKEIITRINSDLQTNATFYTDSNGRELLKRIRNYRPTYPLTMEEKESSNYYPITSKIVLRDEQRKLRMAVLVDRAQGGSSLEDGQIELMVHRRLLDDDAFGVGEQLNETAFGKGLVVRGQHHIIAGSDTNTSPTLAAQERIFAQSKIFAPRIFVSPGNGITFEKLRQLYLLKFSSLGTNLPNNVQILTLEPWENNNSYSVLLRLEHFLEKNEDPLLSKPVIVNLQDIFLFKTVYEMTLGANQLLTDLNRLKWKAGKPLEETFDISNATECAKIDRNVYKNMGLRYSRKLTEPFCDEKCNENREYKSKTGPKRINRKHTTNIVDDLSSVNDMMDRIDMIKYLNRMRNHFKASDYEIEMKPAEIRTFILEF